MVLLLRSRRRSSGQWRKRERSLQSAEHTPTSEQPSPVSEMPAIETIGKSIRQPKITDLSPAVIAQTNWNFVEKLLKVLIKRYKIKADIISNLISSNLIIPTYLTW